MVRPSPWPGDTWKRGPAGRDFGSHLRAEGAKAAALGLFIRSLTRHTLRARCAPGGDTEEGQRRQADARAGVSSPAGPRPPRREATVAGARRRVSMRFRVWL